MMGLGTYSEPIKGCYFFTFHAVKYDFYLEAHWVDEIAKRFFPLAFLIFNIVFWTHVKNQPSIETQASFQNYLTENTLCQSQYNVNLKTFLS